MPSSLPRVVRRSVRSVQNMVGQIVVSVAAAVCVGFITNAYFEEKPASTVPAAVQAADQVSVDTAAPVVDAVTEPSKIVVGNESEAYEDRAPSRPLAAESTPTSPIRNVAEQPMPAVSSPVEIEAVALPPLDSQTIIDLPVRDVDQATGAEIFPGVPSENALADALRAAPVAEQKPERRRFLGLPIPNFVPTPSQFVETASAAGGKIITMVEGH